MTAFRIDMELPTDGEAVLRPTGDLDIASSGKLDGALRGIQLDGRTNVTLDLSRLTFMDSSALRPIVEADQRARMSGGSLLVRSASKQVQRVLELTGVRDVLTLTP
jgi:anti-anti-sigma factor